MAEGSLQIFNKKNKVFEPLDVWGAQTFFVDCHIR